MRRSLALLLILCLLCPAIRAEETEKYVALTFEDGPSGRFTRRLLEGLEQRGVKATFLLCGYRLKDYPAVGKAIFDAGHEIGLHSYSHKDMGEMNYADAAREIADTQALLPAGCKPAFLRPPGGRLHTPPRWAADHFFPAAISRHFLDPHKNPAVPTENKALHSGRQRI